LPIAGVCFTLPASFPYVDFRYHHPELLFIEKLSSSYSLPHSFLLPVVSSMALPLVVLTVDLPFCKHADCNVFRDQDSYKIRPIDPNPFAPCRQLWRKAQHTSSSFLLKKHPTEFFPRSYSARLFRNTTENASATPFPVLSTSIPTQPTHLPVIKSRNQAKSPPTKPKSNTKTVRTTKD
jgi:hypothetical protein